MTYTADTSGGVKDFDGFITQKIINALDGESNDYELEKFRATFKKSHKCLVMYMAGRSMNVRKTVVEQAEDEGLWFAAQTAPEAYLQSELRRLHKIIEEGLM